MMEKMTKDEIMEALQLHTRWTAGDAVGGRQANFAGANLTGANLAWADLRWADLTGANLTGANLTGADLRWANLTGADLAGATLTGTRLRWQSHDLIAEILRQAAGHDSERLALTDDVRRYRDRCWDQWLDSGHPLLSWALDVLRPWAVGDPNAPKCLRKEEV